MHNYKHIVVYLLLLFTVVGFAQQDSIPTEYDQRYREDQFYVGVTYNLLVGMPSGVSSRGLSGGFSFGYLRDMPLNKRRNVAIALGAGMSFDRFGQTLFVGEGTNESTIFRPIVDEINFDTNRFSIATVEAPIEFRWRSSTPESYKFWRVYLGFKVGYTYHYRALFKQSGNEVEQTDIAEFEPLRTSVSLSFGYNTFNFYALYSINPFFNDAQTEQGESFDFRTVKLGLIFYIL